MIYSIGERRISNEGRFFVAPSAQVIGDVTLGEDVNVWFNAVIRADCERITIGAGTNIQDGAVLHVDPGIPLSIGRRCIVGHMAMVHGCNIGDHTLIGIGAIVLNNARIGSKCMVGANSLIPEGKSFPDGVLIMGSPAKVVRELTDAQIDSLISGADHYINNGREFARSLTVDSRFA